MIYKSGYGGINVEIVNLSHFLDIHISILVESWKKHSSICLIWASIFLASHIFYNHSPISNLLCSIMTLHPDILHYYKFYDSRLTRGFCNKVKIKKLFRLPGFGSYWLRIFVSFLQDLPILSPSDFKTNYNDLGCQYWK